MIDGSGGCGSGWVIGVRADRIPPFGRFEFVRTLVPREIAGMTNVASHEHRDYLRALGCFIGTQAPFCWLLATHCWMKNIPSTPSYTFG